MSGTICGVASQGRWLAVLLRPQSGGRRIRGTSRHSHLEDESVESSGFVAGDGAEAAGLEFKHAFDTAVRFMHESF